jgi:hypothetical protein
MAIANHTTCPRCGATLPAVAPAGLCPRCLVFDPQGDKKTARPVSPSPPGRARRKLILASVVLALGAILGGGPLVRVHVGRRRGRFRPRRRAVPAGEA